MDKMGSSFTFFFLFLMEWPLLVCLPYAVMEDVTSEPTNNNVTAHWMALNTDTSDAVLIPHRPALMEVIKIACVALSIALVCGTAVFYMIYRRAQAEQKQQLASLYRNIKIPLLGEEEDGFQDEYKDESSDLRSENGEQLAQFINSAPVRGPVTSCSPGPGVLDHEALVGDTRGDAVTEVTGGEAAV
ncbi:uncharacterized protein C19orf18 homolog [Saccopteryx bilineata]|uniref:uncharacterized protein C19orf18 homolog n=1 Tax=Saccopteryx bilineata TaxID=59482 RepID=UPI00338DD61A